LMEYQVKQINHKFEKKLKKSNTEL
jgi:hypothetical protein